MYVIRLLPTFLEKKDVKLKSDSNVKGHTFNLDWYSDSIISKECSQYEVKTNRYCKVARFSTKLSGMDVIEFSLSDLEKKNIKLKPEPNAKPIAFNQDWHSDSIISKECSEYQVKTNTSLRSVSPWNKLIGMYVIRLSLRYLGKKECKIEIRTYTKPIAFNQDWHSDSIISKECSEYQVKTNSCSKAVSPWTKLSGMDVIWLSYRFLEKKVCRIEIRTYCKGHTFNQDWFSDSIISKECS